MEEKNISGKKNVRRSAGPKKPRAETSASGNGAFADTQGRER
jgi:hypothetical protein